MACDEHHYGSREQSWPGPLLFVFHQLKLVIEWPSFRFQLIQTELVRWPFRVFPILLICPVQLHLTICIKRFYSSHRRLWILFFLDSWLSRTFPTLRCFITLQSTGLTRNKFVDAFGVLQLSLLVKSFRPYFVCASRCHLSIRTVLRWYYGGLESKL